MTKPRLLDLFCGEGGAGVGYARAGWDVTGVDLARAPMRRYPYPHHRGDALAYLEAHGAEFDAIHASPPCKVHTALTAFLPGDDFDAMLFPMPTHTDLVGATRDLLNATGRPWIIENVPGAPMNDPVVLCGTMFGLGAVCADGWRDLRRHRLFESSHALAAPSGCKHAARTIGVYGHGARAWKGTNDGAYQGNVVEASAAIGAPWMSRDGLSQSIPPAYTEWLGVQLLSHITERARGA